MGSICSAYWKAASICIIVCPASLFWLDPPLPVAEIFTAGDNQLLEQNARKATNRQLCV